MHLYFSKRAMSPVNHLWFICLIIYYAPIPIYIVYYNCVLMCTDVKLLLIFLYDEYNWYVRQNFWTRERLSLHTSELSEHLHNLLSLQSHAVYFSYFYISLQKYWYSFNNLIVLRKNIMQIFLSIPSWFCEYLIIYYISKIIKLLFTLFLRTYVAYIISFMKWKKCH